MESFSIRVEHYEDEKKFKRWEWVKPSVYPTRMFHGVHYDYIPHNVDLVQKDTPRLWRASKPAKSWLRLIYPELKQQYDVDLSHDMQRDLHLAPIHIDTHFNCLYTTPTIAMIIKLSFPDYE